MAELKKQMDEETKQDKLRQADLDKLKKEHPDFIMGDDNDMNDEVERLHVLQHEIKMDY